MTINAEFFSCLGRLIKEVGPGIAVTIPAVDSVRVGEMDEVLSRWKGLKKQDLEQPVLGHVLNCPGEKLSEGRPGGRISLKGKAEDPRQKRRAGIPGSF